jgi:hypothetical protein
MSCECNACKPVPAVIAKGATLTLDWKPAGAMLPTDDAARKALPLLTFFTEYFPDVMIELVQLCVAGNIQHNKDLAPSDIKWAREKSKDQLNTAMRHLWDRAVGVHYDVDAQPHLIKMIWRGMAQRQLDIEAERARPVEHHSV